MFAISDEYSTSVELLYLVYCFYIVPLLLVNKVKYSVSVMACAYGNVTQPKLRKIFLLVQYITALRTVYL